MFLFVLFNGHLEMKRIKLKQIFRDGFPFLHISYHIFVSLLCECRAIGIISCKEQGTIDFLQLLLSGVSNHRAKRRRCSRLSVK